MFNKLKVMLLEKEAVMPLFLEKSLIKLGIYNFILSYKLEPIIVGNPPKKRLFDDIEITPFKYGFNACVCISSDLELNWAFMYSKELKGFQDGKATRRNFPYLMNLFKKYNMPVTWAIVGHLFLESCEKINNITHPDMKRPKTFFENENWKWDKGDWYQYDPSTSFKKDPYWYAPDLVYQIINDSVDHEIGSHSFSHIDFSEKYCDYELAYDEISTCIDLMKKFDLRPKSFVFPSNLEGNHLVLKKLGLVTYRGYNNLNRLQYPVREKEDLWDIHQTLALGFKFLSKGKKYCFNFIKRYINIAISNNLVFHLWFHPSMITKNKISLILDTILNYLSKLRAERKIWIATMYDIAKYCEAREKTNLKIKKLKDKLNININTKIDFERYKNPEITLKIPLNNSIKNIEPSLDSFYIKNGSLFLTLPVSIKKITISFDI